MSWRDYENHQDTTCFVEATCEQEGCEEDADIVCEQYGCKKSCCNNHTKTINDLIYCLEHAQKHELQRKEQSREKLGAGLFKYGMYA